MQGLQCCFPPQGVTLLNTAQLYGTSENCIGRFGIRASSRSCPRRFEGHHESNQCGRSTGTCLGLRCGRKGFSTRLFRLLSHSLSSSTQGIPAARHPSAQGSKLAQGSKRFTTEIDGFTDTATQPRSSGFPRAGISARFLLLRATRLVLALSRAASWQSDGR